MWKGLVALGLVALTGWLLVEGAQATHYMGGTMSYEVYEPPLTVLNPLIPVSASMVPSVVQFEVESWWLAPPGNLPAIGTVLPALPYGIFNINGVPVHVNDYDFIVESHHGLMYGGRLVNEGTTTALTLQLGKGSHIATLDPLIARTPWQHINNPDDLEWMTINVEVGGGPGNAPPFVGAFKPVQICPIEGDCVFSIDAADPDSSVSYFLAADDIATPKPGFAQPGPPHALNAATVGQSSGIVRWDTRGATLAENGAQTIYSMEITVTDGKVLVPVDFLIFLEDKSVPPPPPPPKPAVHQFVVAEPEIAPEVAGVSNPDFVPNMWLDSVDPRIAALDTDGDGIRDREDLCRDVPDLGKDSDGDGRGDSCDDDLDGDEIPNDVDLCPANADPWCGLDDIPMAGEISVGVSQQDELELSMAPAKEEADVSVSSPDEAESVAGSATLLGVAVGIIVALLIVGRRRP